MKLIDDLIIMALAFTPTIALVFAITGDITTSMAVAGAGGAATLL